MFSALRKSIASKPSYLEIQANILAGLTVGIIALPLSMALAIASGVPPQHGLYTAIIAGIVIAVSGGSKLNVSGPTAAYVVVLLPIVQQFGIGGLLLSGFIAGMIMVLMGLAKFGKLIEVVPYPVVIGFTAGIGVVIGTLQIKDFLGLNIDSLDGNYLENLVMIVHSLPTIRWQESLIGGLTISVLLLWPRLHSKIPGHLVALAPPPADPVVVATERRSEEVRAGAVVGLDGIDGPAHLAAQLAGGERAELGVIDRVALDAAAELLGPSPELGVGVGHLDGEERHRVIGLEAIDHRDEPSGSGREERGSGGGRRGGGGGRGRGRAGRGRCCVNAGLDGHSCPARELAAHQ